MSEKMGPYQVVELTRARRLMINMLNLSGPTHSMYGLLEVDVTVARRFIAEHKARTGETLSFTGFLVYCLARAVEENKMVQAYRKGSKQLVVFEDVNVAMMIERQVGDKRALMGHVVRCANCKTLREIHQEIRTTQSTPVPPGRGLPAWLAAGLLLPWPLSKWFRALLGLIGRLDPTTVVSMAGTVSITAVGMFGQGHSGWGIYAPAQSLELVVGSMAWKPAVVEGRIEPREILHLTVVFDHDVIDGAPAARFTKRLIELIESASGLDEEQIPATANREPEKGPTGS
jgi:pyruvate/2-oxoglutarate dehydrogenase complex dihydrolipoamide acyltransferase (E2) component